MLGLAAPASAVGLPGFFDAYIEDFDGTGYGVAETPSEAEDFGKNIFINEDLVPDSDDYPVTAGTESPSIAGTARVFSLSSLGISDPSFSDFDETLNRVTAKYTNVNLPSDLPDPEPGEMVFLFFATTTGPYDSKDVAILVEEALIQTAFENGDSGLNYLFYPAVKLVNGGVDDSFEVTFELGVDFEEEDGSLVVPGLVAGAAYVIPEPATALLLGLGLAVLARRRPSA